MREGLLLREALLELVQTTLSNLLHEVLFLETQFESDRWAVVFKEEECPRESGESITDARGLDAKRQLSQRSNFGSS